MPRILTSSKPQHSVLSSGEMPSTPRAQHILELHSWKGGAISSMHAFSGTWSMEQEHTLSIHENPNGSALGWFRKGSPGGIGWVPIVPGAFSIFSSLAFLDLLWPTPQVSDNIHSHGGWRADKLFASCKWLLVNESAGI